MISLSAVARTWCRHRPFLPTAMAFSKRADTSEPPCPDAEQRKEDSSSPERPKTVSQTAILTALQLPQAAPRTPSLMSKPRAPTDTASTPQGPGQGKMLKAKAKIDDMLKSDDYLAVSHGLELAGLNGWLNLAHLREILSTEKVSLHKCNITPSLVYNITAALRLVKKSDASLHAKMLQEIRQAASEKQSLPALLLLQSFGDSEDDINTLVQSAKFFASRPAADGDPRTCYVPLAALAYISSHRPALKATIFNAVLRTVEDIPRTGNGRFFVLAWLSMRKYHNFPSFLVPVLKRTHLSSAEKVILLSCLLLEHGHNAGPDKSLLGLDEKWRHEMARENIVKMYSSNTTIEGMRSEMVKEKDRLLSEKNRLMKVFGYYENIAHDSVYSSKLPDPDRLD